jgi:hypothetical protein
MMSRRNKAAGFRCCNETQQREGEPMVTALISLLGVITAAWIVGVFISVLLQLEDIDQSGY